MGATTSSTHWTDAVKLLVARASVGLGKSWHVWAPRFEFRYQSDVVVCDARKSNSGRTHRAADLLFDLDDLDVERLRRGHYGAFLLGASMRGRLSYARVLRSGLSGAPTDPRHLVPPDVRRQRADDLSARLHRQFAPQDVSRMNDMLRMWSGELDFEYLPNRLCDCVVPGSEATAWIDPATIFLTRLAEPRVDAIIEETAVIANGDLALPPYADDTAPWGARVSPPWGRGTLFKGGRDRPDVLSRFPATSDLLNEAKATGRLVNLAFLTMEPGNAIPRHSDGNPMCPSWHLGLWIDGDCGVEVAGDARVHRTRDTMVFDDSFLHCAWNRSLRRRVVLSAWVLHPTFEGTEIAVADTVMRELGWCR